MQPRLGASDQCDTRQPQRIHASTRTVGEVEERPLDPDHVIPALLRLKLLQPHLVVVDHSMAGGDPVPQRALGKLRPGLLQQVRCRECEEEAISEAIGNERLSASHARLHACAECIQCLLARKPFLPSPPAARLTRRLDQVDLLKVVKQQRPRYPPNSRAAI